MELYNSQKRIMGAPAAPSGLLFESCVFLWGPLGTVVATILRSALNIAGTSRPVNSRIFCNPLDYGPYDPYSFYSNL